MKAPLRAWYFPCESPDWHVGITDLTSESGLIAPRGVPDFAPRDA